ncbi:MAG: methyltransferase [Myxococcota bacterium]
MSGARKAAPPVTLERCRDPGFTPGVRDVPALLELWTSLRDSGQRKAADHVVKALARADDGVARVLLRDFETAPADHRTLTVRALSRLSSRLTLPDWPDLVARALRDWEPRVVREAARAVGKLDDPDPATYEGPLLTIYEGAALPERRAAIEALGRIAGPHLCERIEATPCDDADLERRRAEALTLITRRADRETPGRIVPSAALPEPTLVWLRGREGVSHTVADQAERRLQALSPHGLSIEIVGDDTVELRWAGDLEALYRVRSAIEVALVFPLPAGADLVSRIVEGLEQPALLAALAAWTEGRPRFRLSLASGGRRRADLWSVARRIASRNSPLVNDSREVCWTVEVDEAGGRLLCLPREADPRFRYRKADVPAATHPTLAALLAWAGQPRFGEVVWDPFCGSGSELVECARMQPGLHLCGTDTSAAAIAAARQNFEAAQLDVDSVELIQGSAIDQRPSHVPVSLIVSNPPMGRRVMVDGTGMRQLLQDFVARAAQLLAPGGRVVWLSPAPRSTAHAAEQLGMSAEDLPAVDMGGFTATPQILRKPL